MGMTGRPPRFGGRIPLARSVRVVVHAPYPGPVFESVGWGEILVLVVAGLFILGPERLPSAAAWLGKTMRQVREYATGARDQLRRRARARVRRAAQAVGRPAGAA